MLPIHLLRGLNPMNTDAQTLIIAEAQLKTLAANMRQGLPEVAWIPEQLRHVSRALDEYIREQKIHQLQLLKLQAEGLKPRDVKREEVAKAIDALEKELA